MCGPREGVQGRVCGSIGGVQRPGGERRDQQGADRDEVPGGVADGEVRGRGADASLLVAVGAEEDDVEVAQPVRSNTIPA
jgi:hypothetical protein